MTDRATTDADEKPAEPPTPPASARIGQPLRELCADYYHGLLPREIYRQRRGALLDSLVLGEPLPEIPVATSQAPTVPGALSDDTARRQRQPPQPVGAESAGAPAPGAAVWQRPAVVVAALCTVGLALAGLLWLRSLAPELPAVTDKSAVSPTGTPAAPAGARKPEDFVRRFLDEPGAWTGDAVALFLFEWDGLSPEEQSAMQQTPEFQRFASVLKERVIDERALGAMPPGEGLEGFAALLGLPLHLPPVERAVAAASAAAPAATPEAATMTVPGPAAAPVVIPGTKPAASLATAPAAAANPVAIPTPAPVVAAAAQSANPAAPKTIRCTWALAKLPVNRRSCRDPMASGSTGPELLVVNPGEFTLGASEDRAARPPVQVRIAAAFAIGKYEVTQEEYAAFCQSVGKSCSPSPWADAGFPAVNVSWSDAVDYTRWLSAQTRQRYRLPSEAEWEYAARGGTTTPYSSGAQASPSQIHFGASEPMPRARKFGSNPFGLFHMLGNVREWVLDGWQAGYAGAAVDGSPRPATGTSRTVRGGSFRDRDSQVRSAARSGVEAGSRDDHTGFRVVRELGNADTTG